MQAELQPVLDGNFGGLLYVIVFATAFLAGYLVPAPEEVVFVLLGYAAVFKDVNIFLVIIISILGVVVADNIVFYLGLKGSHIFDRFKHRIGLRQILKYEDSIHKFAGRTIFTSRFIPTIRVLVPILAGTLRVKWRTFFIYDLLASIVNVSGLILLGYVFESQISKVLSTVESTRHILSLVSLAIIGGLISLLAKNHFFKKG